jgi:hypothetical protein
MSNSIEEILPDFCVTGNLPPTALCFSEWGENYTFSQVGLDGDNEFDFVWLYLPDECTDHETGPIAETWLPLEFGTMHQR